MQFGGQPTPWSEVEIEGLRLRSVSQILIQEIGAAGPENAEDSARRACGVIQRQADQIVSADARIAELERECSQWRDELRIYRETENKRISELEQSVTVRDAEIARLETDLELARRDHASSLRLVADIRFALGDDGRRMQPELVEYCNELRRDWDRLDWLKERVSGKEFRRIGIVYGDPAEIRSKIDKARAGNVGEG